MASQKEEASPPASPHRRPGAILGREESGRQHRAGDALQHAGASGGRGKRNPNIAPHPGSHLWDEERGSVSPEGFWGAHKGGLGSSQDDCGESSNVSSSQFLFL